MLTSMITNCLPLIDLTDVEVTNQIVRELRWDCRTETSPITVTVTDGIVTLGGSVKYYAHKHAAEEAAHRIVGVIAVNNLIDVKIPLNQYRGDCEITEAISAAFAWNVLVPDKQITVVVANGIVHLYGTVDCISQRSEAERTVINMLGVRGIASHLAVKSLPLEVNTLCADIKSSFERQAAVNSDLVNVEIIDGAIKLSGKVPSWKDRCAVVSEAAFVHGAHQIIDALEIAV